MKKCHINYDRNNKVIIEAETEAAAERKGNYEIYGDWNKMKTFKNVMEMDKSHCDDEEKWYKEMEKNRKEEKQKKKI